MNERTFQSCPCNILVFTRETCTGKESFEQARISTYHFYIRHICAAINSHDLALERGRQSTCSSPEVCLQNAPDQPPFFGNRGSPGKPGRLKDRERRTQISIGTFQPGKQDYLLSSSTFSGNFLQSGEPKKRFPFSPKPEFSEFLTKWKAPLNSDLNFWNLWHNGKHP